MKQRTRAPLSGKNYARRFERMDWDPGLRERKTITDYLASALRTAIYDGQFADNEELNQVELARHFNVSRVPIREALRQLQAEGLVQSIAHHRTIVSGMTTAQIIEAIEMRAILEAFLLEKAAKRFSKEDIDRLRQICQETDKIKDYGPRWVVKNWEFHRALYAPSESGTIMSAVERIHLNIERYARRAGSSKRLQQAADEHRLILRAVEEGNFKRASDLLQEHILHTGAAVRRQREQPNIDVEKSFSRSKRGRPATRNNR
jgi:DNA-binding GntR family transcriptional regulator